MATINYPSAKDSSLNINVRPGNSDSMLGGTSIGGPDTIDKIYTEIEALQTKVGISLDTNTASLDNRLALLNSGYIGLNSLVTQTGANTCTVPLDVSGIITAGDKVRLVDSTTKFFNVLAVTFTGGVSTITFITSIDYSLIGNPTSFYYSHELTPVGFPSKFNYLPTMTGKNAMTVSSVVITYAEFYCYGRLINVNANIVFTVGGTPDIEVFVSLPSTNLANASYGAGFVNNGSFVSSVIEFGLLGAGCYGGTATSTNWTVGANRQIEITGSYRI